jgi:dephospho-CoA kinase
MSDEEKARRADLVIDNSGPVDVTRHQVEAIYAVLKSLAMQQISGR